MLIRAPVSVNDIVYITMYISNCIVLINCFVKF